MVEVAIFSYNRPAYLKNAVGSVRRNIPEGRLRIYDDGSDDPEMCAYLEEMSYSVARTGSEASSKHGGLYENMQRALDAAQEDYLILMQDDTQIVRSFAPDDLLAIEAAFEAFPEAGFVSVMFMKGERRRRYGRVLLNDEVLGLYRSKSLQEEIVQSYYDVVLCHVPRLRAAGWQFEQTEPANMRQARRLFGEMPILRNPFMFFCPEVPFFRDKKQSLAARMAARRSKGPVFFQDMEASEADRFKARGLQEWPYAEDWLTPTVEGLKRPFVYKDVKANLWLNLLYAVETKLLRR